MDHGYVLTSVLSGQFDALPTLEPLIPKRKLQVFVSSTFTDTHLERNVIMKEVIPLVSSAFCISYIYICKHIFVCMLYVYIYINKLGAKRGKSIINRCNNGRYEM